MSNNNLNATVILKEQITPDLFILRVKPDHSINDFKPGQYVAIGLPDQDGVKILKRAYSIASSPATKEYLEFYIAVVPVGALTPNLNLLKVGDRLHVAPKIVGTFTVDEFAQGKNLILISTGTGLAPFVAMTRTPGIWDSVSKITIVHGVRFKADLAYRDELLSLAKLKPDQFSYYAFVSREGPFDGINKGYVQELFKNQNVELDPIRDHVFLCGNPAMVEELQKFLEEKGFTEHTRKTAGNLHLEKYW